MSSRVALWSSSLGVATAGFFWAECRVARSRRVPDIVSALPGTSQRRYWIVYSFSRLRWRRCLARRHWGCATGIDLENFTQWRWCFSPDFWSAQKDTDDSIVSEVLSVHHSEPPLTCRQATPKSDRLHVNGTLNNQKWRRHLPPFRSEVCHSPSPSHKQDSCGSGCGCCWLLA